MTTRPTLSLVALVGAAALFAATLGCDPHLPDGLLARHDAGAAGGAGGGGPGGLIVTVEPTAPIDGAPRVLHLHASLAGFSFDPTRMMLLEGTLTPRQVHELATGKLPATLAKRRQQVLTWS
jgi:hypothetical protein